MSGHASDQPIEAAPIITAEPPGWRFYDRRSERTMLLVQENWHTCAGWLCWRHPDGHWVALRKATAADVENIHRAFSEVGA